MKLALLPVAAVIMAATAPQANTAPWSEGWIRHRVSHEPGIDI
jgi:hypothetical protein